MTTKKKMQMQHAKRRAVERFGLHLRPDAYEELRLMVRRPEPGKAVFLKRQSNRVTVWALFFKDRWLAAVYDSHRKTIVTILPEEALKPYEEKIGAGSKSSTI